MHCCICGLDYKRQDWSSTPFDICELCQSDLLDCQDDNARRLIKRLAERIGRLEIRR